MMFNMLLKILIFKSSKIFCSNNSKNISDEVNPDNQNSSENLKFQITDFIDDLLQDPNFYNAICYFCDRHPIRLVVKFKIIEKVNFYEEKFVLENEKFEKSSDKFKKCEHCRLYEFNQNHKITKKRQSKIKPAKNYFD